MTRTGETATGKTGLGDAARQERSGRAARPPLAQRFVDEWTALEGIGRRPAGGYERLAWTDADLELRGWFRDASRRRDMDVEQDGNGNLWAWWGTPGADAVVTGSHLDSVPGGGAFDGPLGVVGGFLAVDELRARRAPSPGAVGSPRPVAVVVFAEEEGSRFGVPCLGSRLMTGALDPARVLSRTDASGMTLADAMRRAGADPEAVGPDEARVRRMGAFVELHVEQGRRLHLLGAPVGVASEIWPHGRWRLRFEGEPDHAGTARLEERRDPMVPFAATVTAARAVASEHHGLATLGRVDVRPNATNGVPASVDAWLDARAPDDATLASIVSGVVAEAERAAAAHGVRLEVHEESVTPLVTFPVAMREVMTAVVARTAGGGRRDAAPEIPTGAGHDAGVLAARVPAGMLFVRNPSGVSHSPAEHAAVEDCVDGILALACVLEELAWR